ncbi:hypothetical protein CEQ90_04040 [Lewinellaceae bacterium SD302]|nr:hypothetical protein CEQ90_04040 [Lewinellaceae bacterium SD302]
MNHILLHTSLLGDTPCWWWWIWSLGAMILGCLICRFLFGGKDRTEEIEELKAERDRYHSSATKWETDYKSLKYQLEEAQKNEADLRAALQRCEADRQTIQYQLDTAAAGAGLGIAAGLDGDDKSVDADGGFGGLFTNDNLQIIEGVGPKIEGVLHDAGYKTWTELAAADVDALRGVLAAAGSRYKLADPTSWPHQASLAAAGNWDELIRYQKFTDGGRETTGDFATPSKFEKLAAKKMGFSSTNPNDLKVVEGIGPKIEGLFKDAGVNTWSELAATSTERMQEILTAAGDRYRLANPATWAQQAQLAASGEWEKLSALQAQLRGGN